MDIEISITRELMKNATPQEVDFYERYIKKIRSEFQKTNIYLAIICAQEFARKIVNWNLISLGFYTTPLKLHKNEYLAGGSVLATVWNEEFLNYHKKRIAAKKKALRRKTSNIFKTFITNPLVDPEKKREAIKNWISVKTNELNKQKKKMNALNSIPLEKMEINDYDIFFTEMPRFHYTKVNVLETVGAISVHSKNKELENYFETTESHKLQFIKRIYNAPNNIIGGFDLDPCRFLFTSEHCVTKLEKDFYSYGKREVFTTVGGLYALLKLKQVININCQSKNFYYRIKKYSLFRPIHVYSFSNYMTPICAHQEDDYASFSSTSSHFAENKMKSENEDLHKNLNYLLTGQFEFLFYKNGVIYELADFIEAFQKKKDPQVFFSKTLAHKKPSKKFIKLGLEKIKIFYPRYANLNSKFIIKNPHSQFTGSFNPTSYSASEIYLHPRKINFLNEFPQITIIYTHLKKKIHKQFIYRILRDYFDDIVLKSLKGSCPYF